MLSRPRFRLTAALVAVGIVAAACSSGGGDTVQSGQAASAGGPATTAPAAPDVLPDPSLQLSPETVIVRSNGGRAVKSVPDDRDTIVIDAAAQGADQLDEGEIMLLTGVTVVRVAKLERTGGELRITAAPVTLPEVIRNGDLSWNALPVDLSTARVSVWDDAETGGSPSGTTPSGGGVPGGIVGGLGGRRPAPDAGTAPAEGVPSDEQVEDLWSDVNDIMGGGDDSNLFGLGGPGVRLGPDDLGLIGSVEELAADTPKASEKKLERGVKVKVEGIEYSLTYTRDDKEKADVFKLGLESAVGKDGKVGNAAGQQVDAAEGKVKGSLETEVQLKDINHSGNLKVVDGEVQNLELAVPRLAGEINIDAKFQSFGLVGHMTSDPLFDLPLSLEVPVIIGGVPFTLDVKVGVQVNLSMAQLDNTLQGLAKITFDGDAGFHYAGGQLKVFGQRVQNTEDLLKTVSGGAQGPVGLVFTNELPKLSFGLGLKYVKAGVFLSNGYVASFHVLPMPAPCTATNISYVLASGVTGKFLGFEIEIVRKAITEQQWHFQIPQDQRCNAPK